jgi:predicted adenine nucleotide alpha hydrolase (AANH) superfamily ATPase
MPGKDLSKILKNAAPIPAEEIPRLFNLLLECNKESEITRRETKKYESMKDVMIQEITGKYQFYEFFFSKVFAERQEAIKKDFEIIDKGMKENDRELVSTGVSGLSQVVASSPFTDIEKLKKVIEAFSG